MGSKSVCNILLCYVLINNIPYSNQNNLPEVETSLGKIRGFWKTSISGRKYAAFEGIPYAKPPVLDLRFEEPEPMIPWSGTWMADTLHTCMHVQLFPPREIQGEESCLYLNVYTPVQLLNNTTNLDVIVLIHGGAFAAGSGHWLSDPDLFMNKDVVFVSFNYRLGILGFLSTEDEVMPGNNGMKDQVLALKWVKNHIAAFGGNPNSVTITGISAGGACVHLHYFSPLSKGLFHKGVSQSGTALSPWVIRRNSLQRARKLAVLLGCPDNSTLELKSCLKQRPGQALFKQLKKFFGYENFSFSPFAPVIERNQQGKAFLNEESYLLLKEGNVHDLPWITSIANAEGLLPAALFWSNLTEIDEEWTNAFRYLLDYNDTLPATKMETVSRNILNFYLGPKEKINRKNFKHFTQIFSDRLFVNPAEMSAKMQANISKSSVYFYFFNYEEGGHKMDAIYQITNEVKGVTHAEDAIYFYGLFPNKSSISKHDERMRDSCQNMFYSFASTGRPSFDGTDIWQPTGTNELIYLNISGPNNMEMQRTRDFSSNNFWANIHILESKRNLTKDTL